MNIFLKSDSIIKAKSEFCPLVTILQKSLYKGLKKSGSFQKPCSHKYII